MDLKKELWDKLTQLEEKKQGKTDVYYDILALFNVVGRSEQLCQHEWHKHPSHPKIGAMLCRKCGTELA
jgi:hypothetical protein